MNKEIKKHSKELEHDDISGFEFAKELLCGDETAAINFDRLQKHPEKGYIIFEYLLCEEGQTVTPYTSHPKNYWHKNKLKFVSLWRVTKSLNATLYLVNYAKKGTEHEDKVLLIEVIDMNENGIISEKKTEFNRSEFSKWFREINKECLSTVKGIMMDIKVSSMNIKELSEYELTTGKYQGRSIEYIYLNDRSYFEWLTKQKFESSYIAKAFKENYI